MRKKYLRPRSVRAAEEDSAQRYGNFCRSATKLVGLVTELW
jgi:hypothetical protein